MRPEKTEIDIVYENLNLETLSTSDKLYYFARWLNDYFVPWSSDEGTWIDLGKYPYNTEELVEEFLKLTA
jgi:hypothetical protein